MTVNQRSKEELTYLIAGVAMQRVDQPVNTVGYRAGFGMKMPSARTINNVELPIENFLTATAKDDGPPSVMVHWLHSRF
jgi:hypothetical protein